MYDHDIEKHLVGKKIKQVYMNEQYLAFKTDKGDVVFTVEGDCCSSSYFHDFIGLDKVKNNGPVVSAKEVNLLDSDPRCKEEGHEDCLRCYGFEIVTEDPKFGEVTTVFSFRNDSNGYYGGWMYYAGDKIPKDMRALRKDKV